MKLAKTLTFATLLAASLVQTAAAAAPTTGFASDAVSFTPNPFPQPMPRPFPGPRPFPWPGPGCLSCPPFPIQGGGLQINPVLR